MDLTAQNNKYNSNTKSKKEYNQMTRDKMVDQERNYKSIVLNFSQHEWEKVNRKWKGRNGDLETWIRIRIGVNPKYPGWKGYTYKGKRLVKD